MEHLSEQKAATTIQATFRRHVTQKRFRRQQAAALLIQARVKGWRARRMLAKEKERSNQELRFQAAMKRHRERIQVRASESRFLRTMAAEELAEWNSRRERSARLIQHVWRRWTTGAGSKARSFENSPLARSHTMVEDLAYASDIESNGSSHSFEGMDNEKMSVERKRELIVLVEQRLRAWKAKTPTAENCVEMDALDKKCQQALENVVGVRNSVRAMKRVLRDSELESHRLEQPIDLSSKFQGSNGEVKLPRPGSCRLLKAMESHGWCLVEHGMFENGWQKIKECRQGRATNTHIPIPQTLGIK